MTDFNRAHAVHLERLAGNARQHAYACEICETPRDHPRMFCATCNAWTDPLASFATLERYWRDPAFRAEVRAEESANRAIANAHFDAVRDADLIRLGYIDAPAFAQPLGDG